MRDALVIVFSTFSLVGLYGAVFFLTIGLWLIGLVSFSSWVMGIG